MAGTRSRTISGDGRDARPAHEIAAAPGAESAAAPDAAPQGTIELGIDIVRVQRISDALKRFGERFSRRILTPAEAAYVRNRPETLAGRWAAKEAVMKALGTGWRRGISWRDIEAMLKAAGAEITKGEGSRVRIALNGVRAVFHRPHPQKETDKGAVRSMRRFLTEAGVTP